MTDEPEKPTGPDSGDPGHWGAPSQEDLVTEAMADEIASQEAEQAEQGGQAGQAGATGDRPSEWDGSTTAPEPDHGPSKLALIGVGLVALLAGVGVALGIGHLLGGGGCPPKGSALKVEGTKVTNAEFNRRIELLKALYDVRPPTEPAQLAAFKGEAAKGLAQGVLVTHDVDKRHLQAADKAVRDGLDRFIAQRYPQGGRTQFVQALGTYGISENDVLAEFRRLLETRSLFQDLTKDVKVTEDQISTTFDERKSQLAVPERRHLRHLVVATEDDAKKALARINGPEKFETVAMAVSLDTTTKTNGGDLGTVSEAQLDPAFGKAAFAAAKGATFGPVQTKNGWHIGLVVDVTPGHPVTLAEVHDSLRDTMVAEARLTQWRTYLADRIRTAKACYAKGNRPADPTAPPSDPTQGTPTQGTPTPAPASTPTTTP